MPRRRSARRAGAQGHLLKDAEPETLRAAIERVAAGRALGISDGTVKNHLTDILARLDARDRTHAVLKAIGARLL